MLKKSYHSSFLTKGISLSILLIFVLLPATTFAKGAKLKVLFVGNSYTYVNDLPSVTEEIAKSMGDTLIRDMSAPGGHTLKQHTTNITTLAKINSGDWNYVVLQDQSQNPAFSDAQVAKDVFPYARFLDSLVHDKNPCGRSVFYMTWGYPDGDKGNCPFYPPICTYEGMDSLLRLRYSIMAKDNKALLSPVGMVFNEIMKTLPAINLFDADRMHPSPSGTYAAAVTFYTILFRKDPTLINFDFTITPANAKAIKNVVKTIVYNDLLKFHVDEYDPKAAYTYTTSGMTLTFNSATTVGASSFSWNFGDGATSILPNPVHTYTTKGTYKTKLYVYNCGLIDSAAKDIAVGTTGIEELSNAAQLNVYPNPAHSELYFEWNKQNEAYSINIMNTAGASVIQSNHLNGAAIPIAQLAKGLYFIRATNAEGHTVTTKFIKD